MTIAPLLQPDLWPVAVCVAARVGGLMLVAPLWSANMLTPPVRVALTLVLTGMLLPSAPRGGLPHDVLALLPHMVGDMVLGVAVGLVAALFFNAFEVAGELASLQMGLSLAQSYDPLTERTTPAVSQLGTALALAVYLTLNGHLAMLGGLADSLRRLPPGAALDVTMGAWSVVQLAGTVFTVAVRVAAPVTVALFLTTVALAMLARAVPHVNALTLSFPITIGVGLLALGAALPYVAELLAQWVEGLPGTIVGVLRPFVAAGAH
jgi:flagellar biosynthetic protein FliR